MFNLVVSVIQNSDGLCLSFPCAPPLPLVLDVAVFDHPFHVLVGFLLRSITEELLGSFDDLFRGTLPIFRSQTTPLAWIA